MATTKGIRSCDVEAPQVFSASQSKICKKYSCFCFCEKCKSIRAKFMASLNDQERTWKPEESEPKQDEAKLECIYYFVNMWPVKYFQRFQKWYVRRMERNSYVKERNFEQWAVVNSTDCFHHLKNWDQGLKKSLIKDEAINKNHKLIKRIKIKERKYKKVSEKYQPPHVNELDCEQKLCYKFENQAQIDPKTRQQIYKPTSEEVAIGVEQIGETGQNAVDLETSSNVASTSNITFVDERPVDTTSLHTKTEVVARDTHNDIAENNWTINSVLSREFPLESLEWKVGQTSNAKIFDKGLPKLITDNANCMITRQLQFFAFLRAGVKVRVQLNGTKFHCGRLLVYFKPLTWSDDTEENFYGLTCFPHFFLDASVSNSGEILIPFTHLLSYFSQEADTVFSNSINSLGSLCIRPYNPLQAAENSSQSLLCQIYVSLVDPFVHLPTRPISNFSYGNGYMQGLEGVLKKTAGGLINSGLGIADKFTGGLITGAGDAVCNLLGICDKPTDPVSANPIINRTVSPLCHGAGLDRSVRLALSPTSQTNTTPAILGAVDSDFNLLTLCKMPSLLDQPYWTVSQTPGTKIFDMLVTPTYLSYPQYTADTTKEYSTYTPTMLAYISRAFCYWRGGFKINIQVVATQFHSGRLALVYDPHGCEKVNITDLENNKNHNVIIMDIQEKQELTIELPYFAVKPWLRCDKFRSDANLTPESTIRNPSYVDCDSMGVFRIFVLNTLVRPETVPDKVQINVFFMASDNFELAVPNPVAPLSVQQGGTLVRNYGNIPRYAWCSKGKDMICSFEEIVLSVYNIGWKLFEIGQIKAGDTWYQASVVQNTNDTVEFYYQIQKFYSYVSTAGTDSKCVDFIKSLPNYAKTSLKDQTSDISEIRTKIDGDISHNLMSVKQDTMIIKETTNSTLNTVIKLDQKEMVEQGLESYTTTRENEGSSVLITDGNKKSEVAPGTIGENSMNLQTIMRRYYPLWISSNIKNSMDFTLIAIPVTPASVPSKNELYLGPNNRRYDVHNIAWFARIYTFCRGGLRYKIVLNAEDSDIYVWHNPVDTKTFSVTSGFSYEHIAEQMNFASDLAVTRVQQGIEVEVPFFSSFNQLLHSHVTEKADLRAQNGVLYVAVRNRSKMLNVSIFISTGDDFNLNVLRAPPVVHEAWLYGYADAATTPGSTDYVKYPELQKALTHDSIAVQIPGTAALNRFNSGFHTTCPWITQETEDFRSSELSNQSQQMEEQMFSPTKIFNDITGVSEAKNAYYQDVKPAMEKTEKCMQEMQSFLQEFKTDVLPAILGHAKLFHKDLNESHATIKEFLPKIDEALSHVNAFMITSTNTSSMVGDMAASWTMAGDYLGYTIRSIMIAGIWLNLIELKKKFSFVNLLNIVCHLCALFRIQASQIVGWIYDNCRQMYEDARSKVPNEAMSEQGFNEFVADNSEELSLALAAVATVIYFALFGGLPSWKFVKEAVKKTVESKGKEQGLADVLKNIHFANLGFKATINAFDFFKEWIEKLINYFLGKESQEILLEREFKEKTSEVLKWIDDIEELEDEDMYHLALADVDCHNRFYRLMDQGKEFTRWLMTHGVSKNISSVIRDMNKRLHDMIKRLKQIQPGHGFRYSPFVVMLDGRSGIAKTSVMHRFTDLIRTELDIPYYNSVCPVPKTKEFLDGYEGQAIVEWDDMLQNPKQDEMVSDFINWRSNADCIINKAHVDDKGMHFISKAVVISTNMGEININAIRDMGAFRNRINVKFDCYLQEGVTPQMLKTAPRDPEYSFMRMDLKEPNEDGSAFEVIAEGLTFPEAIELTRQRLIHWNQKQNELVNEYMETHGTQRIPKGVIITPVVEENENLQEQVGGSFVCCINNENLTEEELLAAEMFQFKFEEMSGDQQKEYFTLRNLKEIKDKTVNKLKKYYENVKKYVKIGIKEFTDKIKEFYQKHPTLTTALGILSAFTMVGFGVKMLYSQFATTYEEESNYNTVLNKVPTKIVKAETSYNTTSTKVPVKIVKAESAPYAHTNPKIPTRIVKAEIKEEGSDDIEAINISRNKVHPLVTLIGWETEEYSGCLHCLAIGGKIILTPHHFFRRAKVGEFFFYIQGNEKVLIEFVPERMIRIGDKDACLYYLGPQMDSRKNILNCFIKEQDLGRIDKVQAILLGLTAHGVMLERQGIAKANVQMRYAGSDDKAIEYIQTGWSYPINTVNGDCGSPLIAVSKILPPPAKIIGIHTAGYSSKTGGFAVVLTQEMISRALEKLISKFGQQVFGAPLPPQVIQDEQMFADKVKVKPEGYFSFYGVMDPKFCPSQPQKTQYKPTPWQGEIYPITKAPAVLKPKEGKSPLANALNKYGKQTKPFDAKLIKIVRNDILNELVSLDGDMKAEPTSLEVAIFGIDGMPYCKKINFKSSPGWPYQCLPNARGKYGKTYLFDINNRKISDPLLFKNLKEREEMARNGERFPSIWRDCMKDELRPLSKVEALKTRLFTIAPVDYTILVRKYFLAFEQALYKNHNRCFSAIGINAESYEWTEAYNRLRAYGNLCVAGDFSTFDGTLMAQLIAEAGEIIDDWYKLKGEKDLQATIVRRVLIDEMIHTYQLVQNCVYKTHQGNPSGNPLTAPLNTIVNCFYMRLTWLEIMKRKNPKYATMEAYHRNVIEEMYGDDNRLVIKKEVIDLFNQITITEALAEHGIIYTDELKSSELVEYRNLEDTSFLKRSYRKDPEVGNEFMLPAIDKDTITSLTNWVRSGDNEMTLEEQLIEDQRNAFRFAFFHGREFFEEFSAKLINVMRSNDIRPISLTYDELLDQFLALAHGDSEGNTFDFLGMDFL